MGDFIDTQQFDLHGIQFVPSEIPSTTPSSGPSEVPTTTPSATSRGSWINVHGIQFDGGELVEPQQAGMHDLQVLW